MSQYLILIYDDEAGYEQADGARNRGDHGRPPAFGEKHGARSPAARRCSRPRRPRPSARRRRRLHGHRRPVRRDQGGARRLLRRRGRRPRRGDRDGQADPGRRSAASRSAESWCSTDRRRRELPQVAAAVADAHRREWGFVLAATVRVTRDLDLAEECVQDAYAQALRAWAERGVPAKPAAWLTTTARNRALDVIRRESRCSDGSCRCWSMDDVTTAAGRRADDDEIPDDRLRLICTCCHPALALEAQVALTLRLLCGLTTAEVARAFLVSEATMAARITRAKKKIAARAASRTGCRRRPSCRRGSPPCSTSCTCCSRPATRRRSGRRWLRRATWSSGRSTWPGCCARCCRVDPDVAGLLALILLTDARRATRVDADGRLRAARRAGPLAVGPRRDRRGRRPGARGAAAPAAGPVRAAGGDRGRPRRGAELGRDRLGRGGRRSTTCSPRSGRRRWSR